jgi:hypothetical protein
MRALVQPSATSKTARAHADGPLVVASCPESSGPPFQVTELQIDGGQFSREVNMVREGEFDTQCTRGRHAFRFLDGPPGLTRPANAAAAARGRTNLDLSRSVAH